MKFDVKEEVETFDNTCIECSKGFTSDTEEINLCSVKCYLDAKYDDEGKL